MGLHRSLRGSQPSVYGSLSGGCALIRSGGVTVQDYWTQLERYRQVKTLADGSRLLLRPLAKQAIDAVLSLALTKESTELLAKRAGRRADEPPSDGSGGRGRTATPRSHRAS